MRRAVALLVLLLAGCGGGGDREPPGTPATRAPVAERWPQPLRYSLDVAYDAGRFALAGEQRIALRNTGPEPLSRVWLRAWGNAFGGCARPFVDVAVTSGGRVSERREDCTALEVALSEPLAPGAATEIGLRIDVRTPARPDRFGRFEGAAYFGNALPVLAVADEDGWALSPYTFSGDAFYSLSADWDVRLRLPAGTRAATTGEETAGTIHARAARDFMIVAGPLHETSARAGGVTVRHWAVGQEDVREAGQAIRVARSALRDYARRYGPYGREELDIVAGPRGVARGAGLAMEYPELVISPAQFGILGHEIAHQWWYAIVGNDEYAEPWLDESSANYSVFRLGGRFAPCPRPPFRPPLTSSMDAFERARSGAYASVVYRGGACSLRTLERGLGRARFDELLRGIVREHRDGVLTTAEFVEAVRAAAPAAGVDVDALLRRAGIVPR
jgi:Peptidase family M1 domain